MLDQPESKPHEDHVNPYAAPAPVLDEEWCADDPELEATRRANLADEAYLKALVNANLVVGAAVGVLVVPMLVYLVRHSLGQINAPWVFKPNWIAYYVLSLAVPILGLLAAYGLYWRKRWAILVETLLVFDVLVWWMLPLLNRDKPVAPWDFVFSAILALCLATPFFNVWELGSSAVFRSDYQRVIDATSYIRVTPKLPRAFTLIIMTSGFIMFAMILYRLPR